MTFGEHILNQVVGSLHVFSINLAPGEEYIPATSEIRNAGTNIQLVDYEFQKGDFYYKILKILYDPQESQWLAIAFEMPAEI